jgi:hypothetical protein
MSELIIARPEVPRVTTVLITMAVGVLTNRHGQDLGPRKPIHQATALGLSKDFGEISPGQVRALDLLHEERNLARLGDGTSAPTCHKTVADPLLAKFDLLTNAAKLRELFDQRLRALKTICFRGMEHATVPFSR